MYFLNTHLHRRTLSFYLSVSPSLRLSLFILLFFVYTCTDLQKHTHALARTLARNTRTHTMAPIIQPPSQDTINALQNVLKRRIDTNRIIKEREKKMLSGEDYRLMEIELNNEQFLQPLDADNTKASIYYIRQKFIRYALRLGSK
jgi:hypothetical protein